MSLLARAYSAYLESVRNMLDRRDATQVLHEGSHVYCESSGMDPEYMVLYRGFNGKHAHEGTIYNMLGCRNNALWASPYIEYAIEYASQFGKDGHIAKITVYNSKMNLADMDDLEEVGYEPADAIDIGTDPDAIGHLLEMGKNTVSNYLHDSEDGYCIMDLDIVADIHVMTPEELATAGAEQSELEYLGCDGWFKTATSR